MKKTYILFVILFFSYQCNAQLETYRIFFNKNGKDFKKHLDSLAGVSRDSIIYTVSSECPVNRDLVKGYREMIVYFIEDSPNINESKAIEARILTKAREVIYYKVTIYKSELVHVANQKHTFSDKTCYFKNNKLMRELKRSFGQAYEARLRKKNLFMDYPCHCSNCEEYENKIDRYVQQNNRKKLLKWLQSTITYKQICGLEGFYKLKQKGIILTPKELRIIKNVMEKKGMMYSGEYGDFMKIEDIVKKFKF